MEKYFPPTLKTFPGPFIVVGTAQKSTKKVRGVVVRAFKMLIQRFVVRTLLEMVVKFFQYSLKQVLRMILFQHSNHENPYKFLGPDKKFLPCFHTQLKTLANLITIEKAPTNE